MQTKYYITLIFCFAVSGVLGQVDVNLTFVPNSVPHGEVVVINCVFDIALDNVGIISIETAPDNQLYEWQPDTEGVIGENYEDRIISDSIVEGLVLLELVVDLARDATEHFCVVIDQDFNTYLSNEILLIDLPIVRLSQDPEFVTHGEKVTITCEFAPLPVSMWNRIALNFSSNAEEHLYTENNYPGVGKTTFRFGNDVALGEYQFITAEFTDNSIKGTFVANYITYAEENITCYMTDFEGGRSETTIPINITTDRYITITPNRAVVGEEVEFRCDYGYYADYVNYIYWTKNGSLIITINDWGSESSFNLEGILRSTEGDGYHTFTKIATAEDNGEYGCFVNTDIANEVSYTYMFLTVTDPDDVTTESANEIK